MRVSTVMTKRVVSVKENDLLHDVVDKLAYNSISSLPVVRKGKLVGMVSESDVIKTIDAYSPRIHFDTDSTFAVVLSVLKQKPFSSIKDNIINSSKIKVKDFMNRNPRTISPDADIYTVATMMNKHKAKMIPVVDKKKKLLGVIARADIIRALAK